MNFNRITKVMVRKDYHSIKYAEALDRAHEHYGVNSKEYEEALREYHYHADEWCRMDRILKRAEKQRRTKQEKLKRRRSKRGNVQMSVQG